MTIMDLLGKVKKNREKAVRQKIAIGATIGVTVGAVAGVLLAPKAGKETRTDLAKNLQELPEKLKEITDKTQNMVVDAKDRFSEKTQEIFAEKKSSLWQNHESKSN
jgi:gas vesicle protein